MEWLNYHHLRYFWFVVREGTIAAACKRLHVAQPTVSAQLRALERAVGERLFQAFGAQFDFNGHWADGVSICG